MQTPKMEKLTPLAETRYLNMYDAAYKNRKGEPKHWMIASRKTQADLEGIYFHGGEEKTDAVVLVAIHEETQKLVLIRQFRMPLNDFIYELPAGLIDPGEDALSTVGRELKEETGLTLVNMTHMQDKLYLSAGMTDESVALMYCTCTGNLSTAYLEADETIEPLLVSKEEAKCILASGTKLDIKTYLVIQQFIQGCLAI
ncbi:MAG: NUDIX hydrolase [Niameybacter sp.]|uniref:NUDIX hydrolase n=1 Tax=Niameybacter sp. TaxID=2033640 RepID=UPI002FCA6DBB